LARFVAHSLAKPNIPVDYQKSIMVRLYYIDKI
jgi:hypothetical protein